jgi:ATP-dependent DNA helicase RecG
MSAGDLAPGDQAPTRPGPATSPAAGAVDPGRATPGSGRTLASLGTVAVSRLKGASGKLDGELAKLGIESVRDLLEHYPRRYHDRRHRADLDSLEPGEEVSVVGEVRRVTSRRTRNGKVMVEVTVSDGTATLKVTFFNQGWRARQLAEGSLVGLFGKVEVFQGRRQMTNPVVDLLGDPSDARIGVIVPIYPESGKADVSSWQLRRLVAEALNRAGELAEPLPAWVRAEMKLVTRTDALRGIHRPEDDNDHRQARRRLVFDEFLRIQLELVRRKRQLEREQRGVEHVVDGPLVDGFHAQLPFTLTRAQRAAIADIDRDLAAPHPMHRLLQGDVGSGKTVVAVTALLVAVQGGHQGALMAPTEVLAEQHHLGVRALVAGLTVHDPGTLTGERPVRVELLTSRVSAAARREVLRALATGEVDIVVGTHALLGEGVAFASLGLAVVDEQHRFGVRQRDLLRDKGRGGGVEPDLLVMTATPIPRTAAVLLYGDLEQTELREMPAGRVPITTQVLAGDEAGTAFERLRSQVAAGRQAFVVCPLVEGSDRIEAKAATTEFERLAADELAGLRVELLHGQLKAEQREAVMGAFRAGELDVLVATVVIEVGVDIPNATVMVIEDADRFGLAQLHQLRGRVGRGGGAAWCFLVADPTTDDGVARLAAMADSTDGFHLAEVDLELRGGGEVFGERQSGLSDLKLGRLPRDEKAVLAARRVAERLLDDDPGLERHPLLAAEVDDYVASLDVGRGEAAFDGILRS